MKTINSVIKEIDIIIAILSSVIVIAVTLLGVVMRFVVNQPLAWVEEVQMSFIVWITFLGGSAAFRYKSHIAVEIFVDLFNEKIQKAVYILTSVIVLAILVFLTICGCQIVRQYAEMKRVTDILKIPYAFVYSAVPAGCALMLVNFAVALKPLLLTARERRDK